MVEEFNGLFYAEDGTPMVEYNEFGDENDNLVREWKDLDGNWHYDIIDAAEDRGAEYYDGEYSDPYDD